VVAGVHSPQSGLSVISHQRRDGVSLDSDQSGGVTVALREGCKVQARGWWGTEDTHASPVWKSTYTTRRFALHGGV